MDSSEKPIEKVTASLWGGLSVLKMVELLRQHKHVIVTWWGRPKLDVRYIPDEDEGG